MAKDGSDSLDLPHMPDGQQSEAYRAHLAAIVESSTDAIISKDLNGSIASWNTGAEALFGYSAAEMIGTTIARLVPEDRRYEETSILERIQRGERAARLETQWQTRDGRRLDLSVTTSPIRDARGQIIGASTIARDITAVKARDREVTQLSRLYAALSQINQAIVWTSERDTLFQKICAALVEQGGFRLAWIGWHDPTTERLVPVAQCGDQGGYLQSIAVYADHRPEGCGPAGVAFRSGRPCISNDSLHDPLVQPWHTGLHQHGLRAVATFPIRTNSQVCATLTVYSDSPDYFHAKEIELLERAATDLSFALDNFEKDAARRQAEQRVLEEKRFVESMLESMPGVVYFYDSEGRFLRWNRNFETVSGYSGEEIATMHPLDFFAGQDKALVGQRIDEVFARGESSVEAEFVARDGTSTRYFFTGRRVPFEGKTCLVGVGIDISDRQRAEQRLMDSERKYRELVEYANSIILRWNSSGQITFLNEFGLRFFGYTAEEILDRHVVGTIVPARDSDGRDLRRLMAEICARPETFSQNINENIRRTGERVWISWTNRIVRDPQGNVVEFLSVGTDMTDRLRIEAERERRHRAEAADRVKSAFLATMSHELRTPLNSIIGFTGIILQGLAGPLNAEQSKQLDMVRTSARHLLALVNDILDISKIEAGQLTIAQLPFSPHRSITKVLTLIKPQAAAKQLELRAVVATELGEAVSDERRFEQILLNLLSNAIKFTECGTVTLEAESVADFRASGTVSPQAAIRVRVADTGIGINAEDLPLLFQPFRQLDAGLARKHEGTGLGLAICRRLAVLMGGEIQAESVQGKGSVFTVTLPLIGPKNGESQNPAD